MPDGYHFNRPADPLTDQEAKAYQWSHVCRFYGSDSCLTCSFQNSIPEDCVACSPDRCHRQSCPCISRAYERSLGLPVDAGPTQYELWKSEKKKAQVRKRNNERYQTDPKYREYVKGKRRARNGRSDSDSGGAAVPVGVDQA